MKYLLVSDDHFSIGSSILTQRSGYKYSARLDSLVQTYKWIREVCDQYKVDKIIHAGDMVDSDVLKPEVSSALTEALGYISNYPMVMLLGNHERKDKDGVLNSVSLLKNYSNIELITEVTAINPPDYQMIYVPFTLNDEDYAKVYQLIGDSDRQCIVISHMPYTGEYYGSYMETNGLTRDLMTNNHRTMIFNGHIHNPLTRKDKENNKWIYYQIGSSIGGGFNDLYSESTPRVLILDTSDLSVKSVHNPYSPLFYQAKVSTVGALSNYLKNTIPNYGIVCLQVKCPETISELVSQYIEQHKDEYNIISYRIRSEVNLRKSSKDKKIEIDKFTSPVEALSRFYQNVKNSKFTTDEVTEFLSQYVKPEEVHHDVSEN